MTPNPYRLHASNSVLNTLLKKTLVKFDSGILLQSNPASNDLESGFFNGEKTRRVGLWELSENGLIKAVQDLYSEMYYAGIFAGFKIINDEGENLNKVDDNYLMDFEEAVEAIRIMTDEWLIMPVTYDELPAK